MDFLTLKMWNSTTIFPFLDTALHSYGLCYAYGSHFVFGNILICPIYILRCLISSPMDFLTLKMWNLRTILPFLETALHNNYGLCYAFGGHFVFGNILICLIYILRCIILPPMDSLTLKMWNLTAILPKLDTTLLSYSLLYAFRRPFCFRPFLRFPRYLCFARWYQRIQYIIFN
jgi:hypothetical protein